LLPSTRAPATRGRRYRTTRGGALTLTGGSGSDRTDGSKGCSPSTERIVDKVATAKAA